MCKQISDAMAEILTSAEILISGGAEVEQLELDSLSRSLRISKQTLVRWSDRGLIDASLAWGISDSNEQLRLIQISPRSLSFLRQFAEEYRADTVTRTEARQILKVIDRDQVQRLIRQGSIEATRVNGETRVRVGSVEDYLIELEE
jgi:ubiquinone biosynthesis protein UbiJ